MLEMYKDFCTKYPVISIEDPFEQDDWEPCKSLTAEGICQVGVGDGTIRGQGGECRLWREGMKLLNATFRSPPPPHLCVLRAPAQRTICAQK